MFGVPCLAGPDAPDSHRPPRSRGRWHPGSTAIFACRDPAEPYNGPDLSWLPGLTRQAREETDMHEMIRTLLREIKAVDTPANRIDYQRFFKEKLEHPVGLKTPVLRGVSDRVFKTVKQYGKNEILDICDEMLASGRRYMRFAAFEWAGKLEKQCEKKDLPASNVG